MEKLILPGVIKGVVGSVAGSVACGNSQGDAAFAVPVIPRLTPLRVGRPEIFDRGTRKGLDLTRDMVREWNLDVENGLNL